MTDPSPPAPAAKPPVPPQPRDPVCGMEVDVAAPARRDLPARPVPVRLLRRRLPGAVRRRPRRLPREGPGLRDGREPLRAPRRERTSTEGRTSTSAACGAGSGSSPDPESFLSGGPKGMESPPPPAPEPRWSGCAPWIRRCGRRSPVPCPICGMALEPLVVGGMPLADERNPELENMIRRFWLSFVPALFVFNLSMADMLPGHPVTRLFGARPLAWLQLIASAPVVLWGGWPFFERAWLSAAHPPLQHVHAHRPGHRRGLALQRRGHDPAGLLVPPGLPRPRRRGPHLLRVGRGHRRAGAARADPGAAGAQPGLGRHQGAARPLAEERAARRSTTDATRRSRSPTSRPACSFGSAPARRSRSTGRSSRGAPRWTSRW